MGKISPAKKTRERGGGRSSRKKGYLFVGLLAIRKRGLTAGNTGKKRKKDELNDWRNTPKEKIRRLMGICPSHDIKREAPKEKNPKLWELKRWGGEDS